MNEAIQVAIVAGAFALVGSFFGAAMTQLNSYIQFRRSEAKEHDKFIQTERAVFSGVFSLNNFLKKTLNEWSIEDGAQPLARLTVAQSYLSSLIERSPRTSERLQVSLIDLGLSLEALLFETGYKLAGPDGEMRQMEQIVLAVNSLIDSIETVDTLLDSSLDFVDVDWIEERLATVDENGPVTMDEIRNLNK